MAEALYKECGLHRSVSPGKETPVGVPSIVLGHVLINNIMNDLYEDVEETHAIVADLIQLKTVK